ncbi:GntR family transcriptional regulator [Oceanobacillus bengalensis]|nr:GntR family transcriptional regulator [Oceanobacillus bengalensis]
MSLKTKTITTAAYERLKADICSGKYKAGQHLLEKELCNDLEVSRTPIRDALVRLQEEGLVISKPHRGVFVRKLTEKDIRDYYETRAVLEGLGAKLAALNMTNEHKRYFENLMEDMKFALSEKGDNHKIIALNNALHDYIFKVADNDVLDKMRRTLSWSIALIRATSWINENRKFEVFEEHVKIIKGIVEKQPEEAKVAAEDHIYKAWESAASNLSNLSDEEED